MQEQEVLQHMEGGGQGGTHQSSGNSSRVVWTKARGISNTEFDEIYSRDNATSDTNSNSRPSPRR